jgi:simple sugar transport system ATP-binding protein
MSAGGHPKPYIKIAQDGAMTETQTLPSGQKRIESLAMHGITKRFPGVLANYRVDVDV